MPTIECDSRVHDTQVTDRSELAPGVILLGLHAPDLVRATRAGQYVMAVPPTGEAAATALGIYEAQGERASLLFFLTGKRTRELGELRPGDPLALVGPLGNGFDLSPGIKHAVIVAGGVGIASVLLAAQRLVAAGTRVELLYGARNATALVDAQRFAEAGCELALATDDGSAGHHGFVTALLERRAHAGADLGVRTVSYAARGWPYRRRTRGARSVVARGNVRMRRGRLLGMRRPAGAHVGASSQLSAGIAGRQRRRLRAHLQRRSGLLQRRVEVVR